MDAIRAASQQQVEVARPVPYQASARREESPEAADQAEPSQNTLDDSNLKAVARELAVRFDLKVEVVKDNETGQDVLRVMSPDGKRLLRQFPPDAVLALAQRLRSGAADGLLTSRV